MPTKGKAIQCYNCDSSNNALCHDLKKGGNEIKPEVSETIF